MNEFIKELVDRIEVRQHDNLKELKYCVKNSEDGYFEDGRRYEIESVLSDIKELIGKYNTPDPKDYAPLGKAQMSSLEASEYPLRVALKAQEKPREGFSLKCRHCDGTGEIKSSDHYYLRCESCKGSGVDSEPL
jgi:hypothetical protein